VGEIKKQGIQNTIITYLGIVLGFISLIVVQPFFLTPEEIGLTRVLFSFSSLIAVFIPMGITNITIRYFPYFRSPEKKHHGYFGFMMLFPVAGFLIVAAILYLTKDFFIEQYSKESELFVEFFSYIFPFSLVLGLINILNVYSFSLFKTTVPSLLNDVVSRVLTIAVISVYYLRLVTLNEFIFLFVIIYAFQLLLLLGYVFSVDRPGLKTDFDKIKQHNLKGIIGFGFLLSFAGIASLGLKYLDSIMIARFMPLGFAGIYTIAAFIPTVIEAPLYSIEKIAFTKISQALSVNNMKEVKDIYYKSSKTMIAVGGLLLLGINTNISDLLQLLPDEYSGASMVVFIISIGTFFTMASGANSSIIFNSEHYKAGAAFLIFLALVAFALNIILIPEYGIEGAAMATAISVFIYNVLRYVFILKTFKMQPFDLDTLKVLLLIAGGFLLNYLIPGTENKILNILIRSSLISGYYILLLYITGIAPEINQIVNSFLKPKK
jgi:O-antigen/teichoic acid export membrane protein